MGAAAASSQRGLVLYVEDDQMLAAGTATLLEEYGYTVRVAGDGSSAMRWIEQVTSPPDVLVVDYNLPGDLDGREVAEAAHRHIGKALPTILLSGQLTSATMPWMPGVPILPVWKPVDPTVLVEAVEAFIKLGRFLRARHGA